MENQPIISIGITTYNRVDFLKDLVQCLINQDSQNVEILIGNDYVSKKISFSDLELPKNTSNVKIFNYSINLGEYENLIYLFKKSTGKYFTWQFDDDFYSFDYLSKMKKSINKFTPDCIYCNFDYLYDRESLNVNTNKPFEVVKYNGSSFINDFCNRKTPTQGLTGLYKRSFIEKIGILPIATKGRFALYSEYLLLIHSSKLKSIIYHKEKLIFNRIHSGSFSVNSSDSQYFYEAGQGLIKKNKDILKNEKYDLKIIIIRYFLKSVIKTNFTKSKVDFINIGKSFDYSIKVLDSTKHFLSKYERTKILFNIPLYIIKSAMYPRKFFSIFHKLKNKTLLRHFFKPNF